jgi:hypothetical protein
MVQRLTGAFLNDWGAIHVLTTKEELTILRVNNQFTRCREAERQASIVEHAGVLWIDTSFAEGLPKITVQLKWSVMVNAQDNCQYPRCGLDCCTSDFVGESSAVNTLRCPVLSWTV